MEKSRIKVFAVKGNGNCINVNFNDKELAKKYADAMAARGFVVVRQYREAQQ